jgi:hypothetical protein
MKQNNNHNPIICYFVNVESQKLSEITKQTPTRITIYDNLSNPDETINKIKNELHNLYPHANVKNIIGNNANITNLTRIGNSGQITIYFS